MRIILTLSFMLVLSIASVAQTAAGNAFRIDYDEFVSSGGAVKYLDCGNDPILNPGDDFTVMTWIRLRDIGDNQKIIGKFGLDNTGYILGVDQGRVYAEVWNPTHYEPLDGLMNPTATYWYHIAYTYTSGDALRTYINGSEVGTTPVSDNPIVSSDNNLIIGIASWDLANFQTFGNLDEVALYNVALSEEELRAQIFREHEGDEEGLMTAYNFNIDSGVQVEDISGNGNTCTGSITFIGSEWVPSDAPMADDNTQLATDLHAVWKGLNFTDPQASTSTNGLNLVASGMDTTDYVVFGHNEAAGVTVADIPTNAPGDFERTARIWPFNSNGDASMNAVFNLEAAADGGALLNGSQAAENYTLLWRPAGGGTFIPIAQGSSVNNGVVVFSDIVPSAGEFSIGVGGSPIEPSGLNEEMISDAITVLPNPSSGVFRITLESDLTGLADLLVFDMTGQVVESRMLQLTGVQVQEDFDLSDRSAGIYLLQLRAEDKVFMQSIAIE